MAISTAGDLITFALRIAGVNGVGQTPTAEDTDDGLTVLNSLLAEWQVQRWLIYDLVEVAIVSTAAVSYTVGQSGAFAVSFSGNRPDKIDGCFARLISTGADTVLFPFMSREGYSRVVSKSQSGVPESYFYDAQAGATGVIYFHPVPPVTYELHIQAKASLGQFSSLSSTITLPLQYVTALIWNMALNLRPLYGLDDDPQIVRRAMATMQSIVGSVTTIPQAVEPQATRRGGIFSQAVLAPPQQNKQ